MESDRLSDLLPDLRTYILSFLPTKEAIRLCVLSTQWRYPCSSLPKLEFHLFARELLPPSKLLDSRDRDNFKNCLSKTLVNHTTHIQRFSIAVDLDDEHITLSVLQDWILQVLQHHVTKLVLHVRSDNPLTLPSTLFACSTLRKLKLQETKLTITSNLTFPMLRKLVLWRVEFCDEDDDIGNRIFSPTIFPLLQSLDIRFCHQLHYVSSSIPSLVHLDFSHSFRHPKAKYVSIPTLKQFGYVGYPKYLNAIKFSADTVSSLRSVELVVIEGYPPRGESISNIFYGVPKVETLKVHGFFVDCLSRDRSFTSIIRTLSFNVMRFSLEMHFSKSHVQVVKFLIGNFPLLQILHIQIWNHQYPEEMVGAQEIENGDTRLLPQLRQVKIRNFRGTDIEVALVSYLFSSANILEEMTISCHKEIASQDRLATEIKLKSLPKVSQKLKLTWR